jgi:hypothetical protein
LHIEDRLADGESLPELEAISVTAVEIPDEKLAEYEDELMLANPRIMAEIREARMEYEAGEYVKLDELQGELAE